MMNTNRDTVLTVSFYSLRSTPVTSADTARRRSEMTYEEKLKQANDSLTAAIKLDYARLFDDNYTNEELSAQAAEYDPAMTSLQRRLHVKSPDRIYDRASQMKQLYEREYEYYKKVLSYNLEPHIRGIYLYMQSYAARRINYLLDVMILRHLPKRRL